MRLDEMLTIVRAIRSALSAFLWFTLPFWMVFIALAFLTLWLRRSV